MQEESPCPEGPRAHRQLWAFPASGENWPESQLPDGRSTPSLHWCPGSLDGLGSGCCPCCWPGSLGTWGGAVGQCLQMRQKLPLTLGPAGSPDSDVSLFPPYFFPYLPPLPLLSQLPALLPLALYAPFPRPLFLCSRLSFFPPLLSVNPSF